jgi:FPC/CPF motif-containing protein YcgG
MRAGVAEVPPAGLAAHRIVPLGRHGDPPGPEWYAAGVRSLRDSLRHREYPCHFGRQAFERGQLLTTYAIMEELRPLAGALAYFLDSTPRVRGGRHLLCAFVRTADGSTHRDHDRMFWQVLQYLHDHDPAPWPAAFPTSPQDPAWEFCFNGAAMFVFGAASTHVARASRNLGEHLVLLFQPRSVFLGIEGGTPAGIVARSRIRDRLRAWDLAAPHPAMGDYGDPSNFEWRQYFIPDDDSDLHPVCPLRLHAPAAGGPGRAPAAAGGPREGARTR